ncbi:MAG: molybdopterin molybdotransferase MoeA [Deltaproteobacteria bacterium]|nr:molybdopterin molybdotransferase MoeA [Deltaproteobacteria bacterium]
MQTIREALDALLPAFRPIGVERVVATDAVGRVLAEDVVARIDMPSYDNSAMDGYAVRSEDLRDASETHPVTLDVVGESRAGGPAPAHVGERSAVRVFTGAVIPMGADAVVMQEDVTRDEHRAVFKGPARAGQHVRHRASDLRAGTLLVAAGSTLGPGELCALVSQGIVAITVAREPRVAILATGDELRDLGEPLAPGDVANSNAYMLAAQVRAAGATPVVLPIGPDDPDALAAAVREGLRADLLLSCGGVSVGEHDYVKQAFAAEGVTLGFWKVAMKPGKPLAFGRSASGTPVLGLPGNPVSAFVCFELFARPAIRRMLGAASPFRPTVRARLLREHRRQPGRTELARASLHRNDDGTLGATLHTLQGSGSIPSLVACDALVILDSRAAALAAGTEVDAIVLGERWAARDAAGL